MKAIAQYVMRGRTQAIIVVVGAALLPLMQWLSVSSASLVILRKGLLEGAMVTAWAALPTFALLFYARNPGPLMLLLGTVLMAMVLRVSISWELTLLIGLLAGILNGWLLDWFADAFVLQLTTLWMDVLEHNAIEMTEAAARSTIISFFMLGQTWIMLGLLILARWWQALLYNPGGFQQEFHGLRLSPVLASCLMLAALGFLVLGEMQFFLYDQMLIIPLVLSGLGLIHCFIKERELGSGWIFLLYLLLLVLFKPLYPAIAALGLMDSWMDLRKRFPAARA